MKKIMLIPTLALALLMAACNAGSDNNSQTDSTGVMDHNNSNTSSDTASLIRTDSTSAMNMGGDNDKADFLTEAGAGGMMEVQLGQLAKTHAASQAVKDFGAMMVRDHSNANAQLKSLAAKKNVTLPATLPEKHQKHVTDLTAKNGAEFDKDYMSMMVDDHQEDIDLFEKCSKSDSEDPEVKAFAAKTLPVLRKHLDAAKAIRDKQ